MNKNNNISNLAGVLSDEEILKRLDRENDLRIHPLLYKDIQISGCKVDLHLSGIFYEIKHSAIEVHDPLNLDETDYRRKLVLPLGKPYTLHPGMFTLAPTYENISMPDDLLGILQGRSSLGRLGIIVHATASFIDPGYKGTITLELSNLGHLPVNLYTLGPVATVAFIKIAGKVKNPYGKTVPSPLVEGEQERIGRHDSPISELSKHGYEWEYRVLRKVVKDQVKER